MGDEQRGQEEDDDGSYQSNHGEILNQRRRSQLQYETRALDRKHLDKELKKPLFIEFKDYASKLRMMDSPMFLFGLKLYQMEGHVQFYDADFLNTLTISSEVFIEKTLGEVCEIVNRALDQEGFPGGQFQVGHLKEIDDFDLSHAQLSEKVGLKVSLRFNSFMDAFTAQQALERH